MMKRFRRCILFALIISQTISVGAQTEFGMCLGKIKFIQAPPTMKMEARTMKISMSRSFISPRICARVGGVAFVQVAEPVFEVSSFLLKCDMDSNSAFAVINGNTYNIPLAVWQLQPIVNYANDENNAIVTLFGKGECRIQYHDAFVDKLLGVRILQADLLLASSYLDVNDRWKLPSNNKGKYVMAESEIDDFTTDTLITRLLFGTTYDTMSLYASYLISKAMDSIGEPMSTYIYTDFGEPITFDIENGKLKLNGKPYYRFTANDSIIDTIETYSEIIAYIDTIKNKEIKYKNTIAETAYSYDFPSKIKAIKAIINDKKKTNNQKATNAFDVMDFYIMSDSLRAGDFDLFALYNVILVNRLSSYIDSVESEGAITNTEQARLFLEVRKIINDSSIYDAPALAAYAKALMELFPTDSALININNLFNFTTFNTDDLLIYHINRNGIRKAVFAEGLTNYLRENNSLLYYVNPIVVSAAQKTCQWAAFFRYAKMKNPSNWVKFVKQVSKLKYDAPKVYTPINIEYSE